MASRAGPSRAAPWQHYKREHPYLRGRQAFWYAVLLVPAALLPEALRDGNPLGLWRRVDGALGRE